MKRFFLVLCALTLSACGTYHPIQETPEQAAKRACFTAMLGMPTRSGSPGEAYARANLCETNPNAATEYMQAQSRNPTYVCQQTFNGTVCTPMQ